METFYDAIKVREKKVFTDQPTVTYHTMQSVIFIDISGRLTISFQ